MILERVLRDYIILFCRYNFITIFIYQIAVYFKFVFNGSYYRVDNILKEFCELRILKTSKDFN